ncbi:hypothetical protein F9B74_05860 [Pelistega sp. NLN82]|uniref:T6SS Phospholipase effector Tle1-like catalytic domain-containing protein n=1 Tax=Pelistega ratti TaxID=2652177 RepID=A0A6L9Y5U3_9BURK|nr:DUF2235 domain-containing protein [Pelistega ratti]NEN75850.1 hypothetical protein [Pelistega ratti]
MMKYILGGFLLYLSIQSAFAQPLNNETSQQCLYQIMTPQLNIEKNCLLCADEINNPQQGVAYHLSIDYINTHYPQAEIQYNTENKPKKAIFSHPSWGEVEITYDKNQNPYSIKSSTLDDGSRFYDSLVAIQPECITPEQNHTNPFIHLKDNHLIFNNNLYLKQINKNKLEHSLILEKEDMPIWAQHRFYQENGMLEKEVFEFYQENKRIAYHYTYNDKKQLIIADQTINAINKPKKKETHQFYYAWNTDGSSNAYAIDGKTVKPTVFSKAYGVILHPPIILKHNSIPSRIYAAASYHTKEPFVQYINKNGIRYKKIIGDKTVSFTYQNNRLSTETTHIPNQPIIKRHYYYSGIMPIAFTEQIFPADTTDIEKASPISTHTFYIHNDHIGQPFLVSDEEQNIRWAAYYTPTGEAQILKADIEFNLRQPGQYYDAETGLHDNYLRTYDPKAGHYLEADPIGPTADNSPFGYAKQQPRHFIDPFGLLLFAFDGTQNNASIETNVWKFYKLYEGKENIDKFYVEGPGATPEKAKDDPWWGIVDIPSSGALYGSDRYNILHKQFKHFIENMQSKNGNFDEITPIDIIGFSRGAAISMIFSNYLANFVKNGLFSFQGSYNGKDTSIQTCVDLRFIGLFDAVAQFGANGISNIEHIYTAQPSWELIAHAVALNEYRSLFPFTTYKTSRIKNPTGDPNNPYMIVENPNVIEQGFLGNHTDIGGGTKYDDIDNKYNPKKDIPGDLGNITLAWMHTQASQLGVDIAPLSSAIEGTKINSTTNQEEKTILALNKVNNPLLHGTYGEYSGVTDYEPYNYTKRTAEREYQYPRQTHGEGKQSELAHVGEKVREKHLNAANVQFINIYKSSLPTKINIYGYIDAEKYINWLEKELNWNSNLSVDKDSYNKS